jgi:hypothetical protein
MLMTRSVHDELGQTRASTGMAERARAGEEHQAGAGKTRAGSRESPRLSRTSATDAAKGCAAPPVRSLPMPALEAVMRHFGRIGAVVIVVTCGAAQPAAAQSTPIEWEKGTALAVFGGAASVDGATDGAGGASIGWELTPLLTVEGSGTWLGGRVDAFNALVGARVHLSPRRVVVPFVSGALGMQHATVDGGTQPPAFYGRRMRQPPGAGAPSTQHTFNDFVLAAGGGIDVYLQRQVALRPDVRVLFVRDGGTRTVTVFGIHLAYHFEEHPVTP